MDAAMGRRSVATLRSRFEALRPHGPIPALMAEIPAGHPAPFDEKVPVPKPPVCEFDRADLQYLGFGSVYGPGQTSASPALAHRCLWLAGPPAALARLRDAWRDAAAFASAVREAAGLTAGSGAHTAEDHWLWTMFEVAERRVAFSPLQLRGGSVTVVGAGVHFPEGTVAATRAHPEWVGPVSQIIRAVDPDPTRFWEVSDAIESSLFMLDLADAWLEGGGPSREEEPPPPANPTPERQRPPGTADRDIPEGWPAYERWDAPAWFVARLREWQGWFNPNVVRHWIELDHQIMALHRDDGADQRSPEEFSRARLEWSPEQLVGHMERVGMLKPTKRRGRPHKRDATGLTCNQWVAALFAGDHSTRRLSDNQLEELAKRDGTGWDARTIAGTDIRIAQRAQDLADGEADRRAAADDLGEDLPANGLHLSTRKTLTGRQKGKSPADRAADAADRARDAEATEFIANAERQRRRTQ